MNGKESVSGREDKKLVRLLIKLWSKMNGYVFNKDAYSFPFKLMQYGLEFCDQIGKSISIL